MDWAQLLVIILTVLFALFLLLAIVLAALLVKITLQIKSATTSAERMVGAFEESIANVNRAALPLALAKGIYNQVKRNPVKKMMTKRLNTKHM